MPLSEAHQIVCVSPPVYVVVLSASPNHGVMLALTYNRWFRAMQAVFSFYCCHGRRGGWRNYNSHHHGICRTHLIYYNMDKSWLQRWSNKIQNKNEQSRTGCFMMTTTSADTSRKWHSKAYDLCCSSRRQTSYRNQFAQIRWNWLTRTADSLLPYGWSLAEDDDALKSSTISLQPELRKRSVQFDDLCMIVDRIWSLSSPPDAS